MFSFTNESGKKGEGILKRGKQNTVNCDRRRRKQQDGKEAEVKR